MRRVKRGEPPVFLIGFMAAGKTSVARALARRLDWRVADIDELVEQREHMSVATVFTKHGEVICLVPTSSMRRLVDILTEQLADIETDPKTNTEGK